MFAGTIGPLAWLH